MTPAGTGKERIMGNPENPGQTLDGEDEPSPDTAGEDAQEDSKLQGVQEDTKFQGVQEDTKFQG
jgi:hypothetical protein